MASFNKFNSFVEALAEKVHNLGADSLVIALTNSAPAAANTQLSDISQISYANCSSRALTTVSSSQTAGVYKLVLADLVLTASGGSVGPFRYIVIYNSSTSTPANALIGYYDYGSSLTLNNGETLTIDFDASSGVVSIT